MIEGLDEWEQQETERRRAEFDKTAAAVKAKMAAEPVPEPEPEDEPEDDDDAEDDPA